MSHPRPPQTLETGQFNQSETSKTTALKAGGQGCGPAASDDPPTRAGELLWLVALAACTCTHGASTQIFLSAAEKRWEESLWEQEFPEARPP